MSIVKSFSFPAGNTRGDSFYIQHNSGNFTVIDCYLKDGDDASCRKDEIINEIVEKSRGRVCRFISTHPDLDHFLGIEDLDRQWPITLFYVVANGINEDGGNRSLAKYIFLKNITDLYIQRGIYGPWLNQKDENNGSSGIEFHWPVLNNKKFQDALQAINEGRGNPNEISCVLTYSVGNGAKYMWMGDLSTEMQQEYYDTCSRHIPQVDILFQPHHGRETGAVPPELLEALNPQLIIVGNAPSQYIHYGDPDKTITQNEAGDIVFINGVGYVDILTQHRIDNLPSCLNTRFANAHFEFEGKIWNKCGRLFLRH